ncbi:FAD-dependent oxidoreductase [Rhodococcoides kyotonense]|uniref:ferredoxin--NADP(+) reductase n=1 Tax=Rhodococcoides kyotonense TaxID=398843 RepID=A0A239M2T9_9NOCA|nr:FAD-dependent oxidoreductase [Rhodococcus kyotonensis]SNT36423.1 ferredoxin--NADP+ reductase [Rhodococcus kyotonensis]
MTYVILQSCCNDASCVAVCPVNCIHPTPDEPGFMSAEMLHIDPDTCIDCGACVDECPVDAIRAEDDLTEDQDDYLDLNAKYFERANDVDAKSPEPRTWRKSDYSGLRVAIVGSGPAAFYAALDLYGMKAAKIHMFDRLLSPYGLARFGVAPDHQSTKAVIDMFRSLGKRDNFELSLGVDVGKHVSHDELLAHHDAVIYAVGASSDRRLNIEGEDLPGSHAATEFVAWYNGHPDYADRQFDLTGKHAVVIGNGNVALDVARVLLSDHSRLAKTDIARHALESLRKSNIRQVTLIGRRGVAQAAYTNPEMLALLSMDDIEVIVESEEVATDEVTRTVLEHPETDSSVHAKVRYAQAAASRPRGSGSKRLVLRYRASPVAIEGSSRVEAVKLVRNRLEIGEDGTVVAVATDHSERIEAEIVFRSIGYRGLPVDALPFDSRKGTVPNVDGRVIDPDGGLPMAGVYVTGWIKRGPTGVIGTNKKCATETVDALLNDYSDGVLTASPHRPADILALVRERNPEALRFDDWSLIDRAERDAGKAENRPRVKFVDVASMMNVVRSR